MITLFQVMLGVFFSVFPSRFHKLMFLKSELSNPSFYFSGRVAIYYHARLLRSFYSEVLLPDYLCNVVYRSFEEAGFTTIPILTDAENELCIDDLKKKKSHLCPGLQFFVWLRYWVPMAGKHGCFLKQVKHGEMRINCFYFSIFVRIFRGFSILVSKMKSIT